MKNKIFSYVKGLNPQTSEVSSLGKFVSSLNQQVSDSIRREVVEALPHDSLAYSIATTSNKFTDKQLWVITYALLNNSEFVSKIEASVEDATRESEANREVAAERRAKKAEKKAETAKIMADNVAKFEASNLQSNVSHAQFGEGVVIASDDKTITIVFKTAGEKKLMKAFANLTYL